MDDDEFIQEVEYVVKQFKNVLISIEEQNQYELEPVAIITGIAAVLGLTIGSYEEVSNNQIPMDNLKDVIDENIIQGHGEVLKRQRGD